jgi:hypothetical protein
MYDDIRIALEANKTFYDQESAGEYDTISSFSSDDFKAATGKDNLMSLLKTVRKKSAGCSPPALVLTSHHLGEALVDLTYVRQCPDSTKIMERFSWRIANNRAVLNGYFASGDAPTGH